MEASELKYRWVILALAWLSFMASWIPRTTYPPLIPEMSSALKLTYTQAGLLMTGFWVGYIVTQLPSGYISDRIGVRRTLAGALALIGIFSMMAGTASSFTDCLAYRTLCGLAAGCIFAPGSGIVLRWFHPKDRGTATSLYVTGSRIGAIIGLTLSPAISAFFDVWRWSFWILSAPAFLTAITVFLFMKESPETGNSHKVFKRQEAMKTPLSYGLIFEKKSLWLLILATCGYFCAFNTVYTWVPTYLFETFGVSLVSAGLVLSLFSGLGIVGAPLGGIVADRVIKRKASVIFLGFMTMSLGCLAISFVASSNVWPVIGLLILIGIFGSIGGGLGIAILSEWFPLEISGTASGLLNLSTLGGAVGPYIFGAVLDITGSFTTGWMVSGAMSVVLVMLMIPMMYREKH